MKRLGRVKEALLTLGSQLSSDQTGYVSPWRLFIIIIASIFVSEIVAMIVVYFLDPISYFLTTLIDAGIMVILICPILYLFSFRPLIQYVESLRQSEQKVDLEREGYSPFWMPCRMGFTLSTSNMMWNISIR